MNQRFPISGQKFLCVLAGIAYLFFCVLSTSSLLAQTIVTNDPPFYGPFNGLFLAGGNGLKKAMVKDDSVLRADSPWSMSAWVRTEEAIGAPMLVAGMGDLEEEYSRYLAVDRSRLMLWMGKDNAVWGSTTLNPGEWHLLAATFDGESFHLYNDGA